MPKNRDNTSSRPLRIGLTGGIASGKSTVADIFEGLGASVIDTDVIAREVVKPGEQALEKIRDEFGDDVINDSGGLDRSAMRRIVFGDDDARKRLEGILHPLIRDRTMAAARTAGGAYQVIVVPLLVESPLQQFVDRIVVVDCDERVQIQRLMARDAESEGQARRILAAQSSREERLKIADDVVMNDSDLTATVEQVQKLHESYLRLAQEFESQPPASPGEDTVAD
ncbi:MAG: dephospho-CoA kinase [Gammaproteobacteria bacterium]|nr:dephospho-CoA kinase [Gammaproteobacteria bacterium]NNC76814.1 dephospho-CoA kinase [Woeseiaceae bacterium]